MAQVIPFRAHRYRDVDEIENLITPPYDVISPEEKDMFLKRHPNNIIRLILGGKDAADMQWYAVAEETIKKWILENVLIKEDKKAIYAYEQEYIYEGKEYKRLGFIAAGRVHPYEDKVVIPHERTLSKAKEDRLRLTRATNTSFGLIFMLYDDNEKKAENAIYEHISEKSPEYQCVDYFGIKSRIWVITDENVHKAVQEAVAPSKLYIADGHHRYETGVRYMQEQLEKYPDAPDDAPFRYNQMMFVNMANEGLLIFPTHRLIKNVEYSREKLISELENIFDIEEFSGSCDMLIPEIEKRGVHAFGLYDGASYILTLKNEELVKEYGDAEHTFSWNRLDVSILHSIILTKLGITPDNLQEYVKYTREKHEPFTKVDSGEFLFSVIMNPPTMDDMKAVAEDDEKMPQKSTYFYPKLVTGYTLYRNEEFI